MKAKDQLKVASPDEAKVNLAKKVEPDAPGNKSMLPHERDQSLHSTSGSVHPEMEIAHIAMSKKAWSTLMPERRMGVLSVAVERLSGSAMPAHYPTS